MPEYRDKKGDEKMEAFNDRTKRIDFPYVLSYDDEAKIHRKMLRNADLPDIQVEPHTQRWPASSACSPASRNPDTETVDMLQKVKAYNGEIGEADDVDVKKLRDEAADKAEIGEGHGGRLPMVHRRRDRRGNHGLDAP